MPGINAPTLSRSVRITRADLDRYGRGALWANRAGALEKRGRTEEARTCRLIANRAFEPFSNEAFEIILYLHHREYYPDGKPN